VNKNFKFKIGFCFDAAQFFKRKFPRQYHARNTVARKSVCSSCAGNVHLCRSMKPQRRKLRPRHCDNAKVLHDESIRPLIGEIFEQLIHTVCFALFKDSIHCNINFFTHTAKGAQCAFKLSVSKISAS
jgi:hypothetical protein